MSLYYARLSKGSSITLPNIIIKNVGGGIAQDVGLRIYLSEEVFGQTAKDGNWYDTGSRYLTSHLGSGLATGTIYGSDVRLTKPAPARVMALAKVSRLLAPPIIVTFTLVPKPE